MSRRFPNTFGLGIHSRIELFIRIRPIAPGTFVVCKRRAACPELLSPDKQLVDCGFSNNLNFKRKSLKQLTKSLQNKQFQMFP